MLEEISKEVPDELFRELNGGILLLPETKLHPESESPSLYTMGEYRTQIPGLGRYIVIYYGSFMKAYGEGANPAVLRRELRKTLLHEFRHHLETLAGVKDLVIEDEIALERYRVNLNTDKS
jgi:hypothetical protein